MRSGGVKTSIETHAQDQPQIPPHLSLWATWWPTFLAVEKSLRSRRGYGFERVNAWWPALLYGWAFGLAVHLFTCVLPDFVWGIPVVLTFDCNSGQGPHPSIHVLVIIVTPIPTALDFGEWPPFMPITIIWLCNKENSQLSKFIGYYDWWSGLCDVHAFRSRTRP